MRIQAKIYPQSICTIALVRYVWGTRTCAQKLPISDRDAPTPGPRLVDRSDLSPPKNSSSGDRDTPTFDPRPVGYNNLSISNATINMVMIATTKTD
uniref:Uncharacterized protein n=1 Tax=Oryza sativa subsp. japonica TaxID=39947 RepID=Q2QR98_ORYSJ|nr:hypothetical protein LOC_Os12g28310 [Oryza sativa Japonica Group]